MANANSLDQIAFDLHSGRRAFLLDNITSDRAYLASLGEEERERMTPFVEAQEEIYMTELQWIESLYPGKF